MSLVKDFFFFFGENILIFANIAITCLEVGILMFPMSYDDLRLSMMSFILLSDR